MTPAVNGTKEEAMATSARATIRTQLERRRERLAGALSQRELDPDLPLLLGLVDTALAKLDTDAYGRCLVCEEPVDERDLLNNPLLEYCLCNLTPSQQRALEHDLNLARRLQAGLLPDPDLTVPGWEAHYRYEPAGIVSGDYCDVWTRAEEPDVVHFAVADVAGKGVAAALLMAHIQAAFRSLSGAGVGLPELVGRMNRQLLAANLPTHYATLVCGRATPDGRIDLVNAGHCPPLVASGGGIETLAPTGMPVGMFADRAYEVTRLHLHPGDAVVLYTDGVSEARDGSDREFTAGGVARTIAKAHPAVARSLVGAVRDELGRFLRQAAPADDLTILALVRGRG